MLHLLLKFKPLQKLICQHDYIHVGNFHNETWVLGIHPVYNYSHSDYNCIKCGKIFSKKYLDPQQTLNKLRKEGYK